MLVIWGVRNQAAIARQNAAGNLVCVLERGYAGDRFSWTSVSFGGGLNGEGRFYGPFSDASRWEKNFSGLMKPWRTVKEPRVLILGQVPSDMALKGYNPEKIWAEQAALAQEKGFDVFFRPHPLAPNCRIRGFETLMASDPLVEQIKDMQFCLTINSNSAVDCVLAGVPCVTLSFRSMARDVTGKQVGNIIYPDRQKWAHSLAWKQWQTDEMADGSCWAAVGEGAMDALCEIH